LHPDHYRAYNNLGNVFCDEGRFEDAIGCYESALRLKPGYAEAHNNLAAALARDAKFGYQPSESDSVIPCNAPIQEKP
jgi:tetratricopeptide (TPR) repeat protein